MITFVVTGSFANIEQYLKRVQKLDILSILNFCGELGVSALSAATPADTRLASNSWSFEASSKNGMSEIVWTNSNVENGFPVVIMLQYGHGTGSGGYVNGQDFINPAMRPVFDKIATKVWKAVTSA